jgi:hypothetical protein
VRALLDVQAPLPELAMVPQLWHARRLGSEGAVLAEGDAEGGGGGAEPDSVRDSESEGVRSRRRAGRDAIGVAAADACDRGIFYFWRQAISIDSTIALLPNVEVANLARTRFTVIGSLPFTFTAA